jgi:hypothetical protein
MKLAEYTREELEVLEIALYGHYNFYRKRFEEVHDLEYRNQAMARIRLVEKIISDIGASV